MQPLSFEASKRYYRAPIAFGPAPTPRADKNGEPFPTWKTEAWMETTGVVFDVDREGLQALLPEGYEIDPDKQPTIMFEVMLLRNLPWLNGRGYNTLGVYANDIICHRATDGPIRGSYMLVLWESFTDPITTGREELGFCKLWAEMPDPETIDGTRVHKLSWFGNEFLRMTIPDIKEEDVSLAPSQHPRDFGHPSVEGTLHHRYVPMVGHPGRYDASYATYMPGGGSYKPTVEHYLTTSGDLQQCKVEFGESSWETLPTLHNVVDGLKSLKLGKVREAAVQKLNGASDCSANKRVEW
ncbi:hypothetical protein P389DRAFT_199172 [Cystobasidium minutum MCA 4210]|uniref:uncharacterized protein n=1 Tax=Cystobasidium minutum MCA 4210 TaxID=1397322 RepID=UPI0034CE2FF4|eukprot:jgi/Rhomi1/199172/MIX1_6_37